MSVEEQGPFVVQGYDSFEGECYNIHPVDEHTHNTFAEAEVDAREQWQRVQAEQPQIESGETQDEIYIVDLSGNRFIYPGS